MCILQQDQHSLFSAHIALQFTQLQPLCLQIHLPAARCRVPQYLLPKDFSKSNPSEHALPLCLASNPTPHYSCWFCVTSKPSAVFPGIRSCSAAPSLPQLSQHPSSCSPQTAFSSFSSRPNPPSPTTHPKAPQCPIRSTLHYLLHPSQPHLCFLSLAKLTSSIGIMPLYKTFPKPCFCL